MAPDGLSDLLESLDLSAWYALSPHTFDGLIYLVLFLGVARVALGGRFHGRGGRAIVLGVGVSLALAASVSAVRAGFTLDRLAPVSWLLLGLVLFILIGGLIALAGRGRAQASQGLSGGVSSPPSTGGASFSFHLHTDRMPDPCGRRARPSGAPSPTDRVAEAVRMAETTVSKLLDAFAEHAAMHGLDHHPESFLIAIARTQRDVERAYHSLLTLLARSGWRRDPDKHLLAADVESVIQRVSRHTALFHEAMRFAEAGIHGGNLQLLRESIAQMQLLEQDSIRLTRMLEQLIERLGAEHPSASRASSSQASSTTRGRDGG